MPPEAKDWVKYLNQLADRVDQTLAIPVSMGGGVYSGDPRALRDCAEFIHAIERDKAKKLYGQIGEYGALENRIAILERSTNGAQTDLHRRVRAIELWLKKAPETD